MKKSILGLALFLVSGCLPLGQANQIIVDGEASLEFEPEVFSLSGAIRARSDTQAAALAEIASKLANIRETMPNLEGITNLAIDASNATITPIQNPECTESRRYNTEAQCPVEGYFGSISIDIEGAPANLSGQTLSLLSELGAESVSLSTYSLIDPESAQQKALDAAVRDARRKAEKIATASNSVIAGPIRIQYGEGFSDGGYSGNSYDYAQAPDTIVVTGSRIAKPETNLDLDPQPINVKAKIVAAFEIE